MYEEVIKAVTERIHNTGTAYTLTRSSGATFIGKNSPVRQVMFGPEFEAQIGTTVADSAGNNYLIGDAQWLLNRFCLVTLIQIPEVSNE